MQENNNPEFDMLGEPKEISEQEVALGGAAITDACEYMEEFYQKNRNPIPAGYTVPENKIRERANALASVNEDTPQAMDDKDYEIYSEYFRAECLLGYPHEPS